MECYIYMGPVDDTITMVIEIECLRKILRAKQK